MADISDLMGDTSPAGEPAPTDATANDPGMMNAVNNSLRKTEPDQAEIDLVIKLTQEYQTARDFDKGARKQYGRDRKYAAGIADPTWASDANLIGSFIDIMSSFLYARNPDVSARPSEKVGDMPGEIAPPPLPGGPGLTPPSAMPGAGPPGLPGALMDAPPPTAPGMPGMPPPQPGVPPTPAPQEPDESEDATRFAMTAELVVSKLWKMANLKRGAKKTVRSALSVGPGWFKALTYSQKMPAPLIEKQLRDEQASLELLAAQKREMTEGDSPESVELQMEQIKITMQGLAAKIAKSKRYGMTVDFVRADDIQVSLDIASTSDYLDSDWMSEDMYIPFASMKARFPNLTEDDFKGATKYYQRNTGSDSPVDMDGPGTDDRNAEGQYSRSAPSGNSSGGKPVEFVKIVELWDRRDGMIKTFIDGVKRWAVPPYAPPQATSRFYGYFRLAFYEVDGQRHPQSLVMRLAKLQDEYSSCRSNWRTVRARSLPGLVFNEGSITPEDARKLSNNAIGELIGINPTDGAATPLQNLIIAKPLPTINPALYATEPITADMERISGVQEALQSSAAGQPKTATEANIEQTGFASRTNADRDVLEDLLDDLAQYTLETAIQECPAEWVQRLAGPKAFWPYGMDVQDILGLVEISIDAGTTGKPNAAAEKAAWATILPILEKSILQIRQIQPIDPPLAEALTNVLRETLHRMDDRLDIDEFIPAADTCPPPPPPPKAPPPQVKIGLTGKLDPMEVQQVLQAEAIMHPITPPPGGAPGLPPGGLPSPMPVPAGHPPLPAAPPSAPPPMPK